MPITIAGSGTITGISAGGLPDGVITTDDIAASAITRAKMGYAGAILQVVTATTSTQVTVASTTYTDSGLTASITPTSSSSKILVLVSQVFNVVSTSIAYGGIRLMRDSTTIFTPVADATGPYEYSAVTTNFIHRPSLIYLDSPATTSSTTYKTQGRPYTTASSGSVVFQNSGALNNSTSTITLLEVTA